MGQLVVTKSNNKLIGSPIFLFSWGFEGSKNVINVFLG